MQLRYFRPNLASGFHANGIGLSRFRYVPILGTTQPGGLRIETMKKTQKSASPKSAYYAYYRLKFIFMVNSNNFVYMGNIYAKHPISYCFYSHRIDACG